MHISLLSTARNMHNINEARLKLRMHRDITNILLKKNFSKRQNFANVLNNKKEYIFVPKRAWDFVQRL